jgi:hypothetical protein
MAGNNSSNITIFPNPFTDIINLNGTAANQVKNIVITDISGKTVYQYAPSLNEVNMSIDLGFLEPGIYFLKTSTINGSHIMKLNKE